MLLEKNAIVLGVADQQSIAWAIAQAFHAAGAQVTIGYQQKFLSRVAPLLESLPGIKGKRCDLLNPMEMEEFFKDFKETGIDALVHSVAFGPPSIFSEPPSQVNSMDFGETFEVSVHSFGKTVRFCKPYLKKGASVLTLTFQASQRAMPMYGMMGVAKAALESLVRYLSIELGQSGARVNAISAGPVATLAAYGEIIALRRDPEALERLRSPLFKQVIREMESVEGELEFARACWDRVQKEFSKRSALPETLEAQDVANVALFLASDLSRKVTGQVLTVDCGYGICDLI